MVGYATIIINIFEGFDALEQSVENRYDDRKKAYIGIIATLGGIAVLKEGPTEQGKKRKKKRKLPQLQINMSSMSH